MSSGPSAPASRAGSRRGRPVWLPGAGGWHERERAAAAAAAQPKEPMGEVITDQACRVVDLQTTERCSALH